MNLFKQFFLRLGGGIKFFWIFILENTFLLKLGGGVIVFYVVYIRFFRPRATGPIDSIYSEIKFYLYIFMITSFFFCIIFLISAKIYMNYLLKQKDKPVIQNTLFIF